MNNPYKSHVIPILFLLSGPGFKASQPLTSLITMGDKEPELNKRAGKKRLRTEKVKRRYENDIIHLHDTCTQTMRRPSQVSDFHNGS